MNSKCSFTIFVICILLFSVYNKIDTKSVNNLKQEFPVNYAAPKQIFIQSDNNSTSFDYAVLDECNSQFWNPQNGKCIDEKICQCLPEFANYSNETICGYERKKVVIAFYLEVICPIGSAYFYLGERKSGIFKSAILILLPAFLILTFCFCCGWIDSKRNRFLKYLFNFFFIVYLLGFLGWLVYDLVKIATNQYTDSNGIKLAPWTD